MILKMMRFVLQRIKEVGNIIKKACDCNGGKKHGTYHR